MIPDRTGQLTELFTDFSGIAADRSGPVYLLDCDPLRVAKRADYRTRKDRRPALNPAAAHCRAVDEA